MRPSRIMGRRVQSGGRRLRKAPGTASTAGFSVIELLVAMVILMVIVAVFSRFFQRSTQSWESGMRTVEASISGRSALNLIVRDIERAVADPVLVDEDEDLFGDDDWPAFGIDSDAITFIAMSTRPPYRVQRLWYRVSPAGELIRSIRNLGTDWVDNTVIGNVVSLGFAPVETFGDQLPDWVSIRLRLSSRYDDMASRDQEFVGRAYPVHRQRYPSD